MFKKLKDKIVEEAKNSPQRFQQITQSVSDKLQSSTIEENFFSIDDDVDSRPSASITPTTSNDGGFTSVSLYTSTPIEPRQRRTSNSSMASDVSFLPRYEPGNLFHLQSDIEASASEMEDNVSTSSTQMDHITKEQVYAELQRIRLRYHKYRGRYTDLANHYKDLERENGKMKSVLVETQDISIRRVGELREQCQLEQKAKAHLENALRVEIDEKQYIIDTLKTKIELLHSSSNTNETVCDVETGNGSLTNGNRDSPPSPESTLLSTDLANAKTEIATLNERLQELKASKIISQTKEANLLTRINELEAEMMKHTNNSSKLAKLAELESKVAKMAEMEAKLAKMAEMELAISKATESESAKFVKLQELEVAVNKIKDLERQLTKITDLEAKATKLVEIERKNADLFKKVEKMETDRKKQQKSEEEYNLQMARDKMTLHTELQNKDLEVNNLKSDLEALKDELETYRKETAPKNVANNKKMDNLQSQNTKLIDKVELLTAKCNNMEAELLKMEQLRQENKHLAEVAINLKEVNKGFSKELSDLNKLKDNCNDTTEVLEVARNDIILLSEEKTNLQQELEKVIKSNANINEMFSDLNLEHNDLDGKYNKLLIDNTSLSDALIAKNKELEKIRSDAKSSLLTLEAKITKKLQQKFDQRSEKLSREYEEKVHKLTMNDDNIKEVQVKLLAREDSIKLLKADLSKISEDVTASKKKYNDLENDHLELIEENRNNLLENKNMVREKSVLEKVLEVDAKVIEGLQEQGKSQILEITALKDRLETSMYSNSALEQRVRNLEQVMQAKEDHFSECNSKINNKYKRTIESLEKAIKIKNSQIDRSDTMLKELSKQVNTIKDDSTREKCEAHIKLLQDELNATKTDNVTLNSTVTENNEEISLLKGEMVAKESDLFDLNEKIKGLAVKLDGFAKESGILKQEKHEATKQAEILIEQKIFSQKHIARVIAEIKEEFVHVKAETSNFQSQLGDLNIITSNFGKLQLKNDRLLEENRQLSLKMESIIQENISINEEMFTLKSTLSDSSKRSEELVRLNADKVELVKEVGDLNKIVDNITSDQKRHKQQIVDLEMAKEEMGQVVDQRNKCLQEISDLKGNLQCLVNDRQHLEQQTSQLQDVQRQYSAVTSELCTEREKTARLNDELSLFSVRSRQLVEDRDRLVEENERMIVEVERVKLLVEEDQKQDYTAQIADLTSELGAARNERASLTSQLEASNATVNKNSDSDSPSLISGITLQEKITELSEMRDRFEVTAEESRTVKEELLLVVMLKEEVDGERKRLELMVGDLDRSYSEIKHENQLLKDEIQELKISPINLNSSSKSANNFNLSNGNNNNTTATIENLDLSKEVDQLKEKVLQYKAIDATNRSSIEFYELELDRARARGEKLERKLDETLVTLRHCAELSGVETQVEYLRHVLYNYMLGREGAVLARVIAAVCKFDPAQTEAVLKHEQQKQKQTLLGQLGIL